MVKNAFQGKGFLGAILPALNRVIDAGASFMSHSLNPVTSAIGTGIGAVNQSLGNLMSSVPQQGEVSDLIKFKI